MVKLLPFKKLHFTLKLTCSLKKIRQRIFTLWEWLFAGNYFLCTLTVMVLPCLHLLWSMSIITFSVTFFGKNVKSLKSDQLARRQLFIKCKLSRTKNIFWIILMNFSFKHQLNCLLLVKHLKNIIPYNGQA